MRYSQIIYITLTAFFCLGFISCSKHNLVVAPTVVTVDGQAHYFSVKPLILVDGVEVDDVRKAGITPNDFKIIHVLKPNSTNYLVEIYGPKAKNGVISVSTLKKR